MSNKHMKGRRFKAWRGNAGWQIPRAFKIARHHAKKRSEATLFDIETATTPFWASTPSENPEMASPDADSELQSLWALLAAPHIRGDSQVFSASMDLYFVSRPVFEIFEADVFASTPQDPSHFEPDPPPLSTLVEMVACTARFLPPLSPDVIEHAHGTTFVFHGSPGTVYINERFTK